MAVGAPGRLEQPRPRGTEARRRWRRRIKRIQELGGCLQSQTVNLGTVLVRAAASYFISRLQRVSQTQLVPERIAHEFDQSRRIGLPAEFPHSSVAQDIRTSS